MDFYPQRQISQSDCEISSNCVKKKSMCASKGHGFLTVFVRNAASVLIVSVLNRAWFCTLVNWVCFLEEDTFHYRY